MKKQENSPEELDEMEARNWSDRDFRVIIIRILKSIKEDIETIKKNMSEMYISEIHNTLGGINSRLEEAKDRISDLEDKGNKKCPGRVLKIKKNI